MRPTIMEVDIHKFYENLNKIKKYIGNKKIMPVVKANAYGTYLQHRLELMNHFDIVAVAIVDEAIQLRNLGYEKEIFLLNQPCIDELNDIIKYHITIGLSDISFLEGVFSITEKVKVHLEIETGMNRTGISLENLKEFIHKVKQNNFIIVEGCYTHLSSADNDYDYTMKQLSQFHEAVSIVKESFDTIRYVHSSASNGILNYNDDISNIVRPGLILYGYEPFLSAREKINVEPICCLKTKITFLKDVNKGSSISYSRSYVAERDLLIATIPIGYADGLRRELSNRGYVVIHKQKARIVGNICMDSCMIDVTDIENVSVGDEVYIWDNEIQTLEDIADDCETISYEVLSTISSRVPRVLINDVNKE